MSPRARGRRLGRLFAVLATTALLAGAWGTSGQSASSSGAVVPTTNLSDVCPETLTLQIDWFPEAERDWARTELRVQLHERLLRYPVELVLPGHGEPVLKDARDALERGLAS